MKVLTAALGHRTDDAGTLLVFRTEVGHGDLELGNHVGVRIHWRGAVTSRIGYVRAVSCNVKRVSWQPVIGVGAVERALIAAAAVAVDAGRSPRIIGAVRCAVRDAEAWHDLNELSGIGAHLNE